ncbi:MAG: methyltransferase domain-containing protein [Epsilonproteobacteria bacterium]|nr:methyltransferase domain-containing protein [Campylobacterota bacterium]
MNVIQEFSRFANLYESHNTIQSQVAQKLVSMIEDREYKHILDIGCGSGAIYKKLIENDISFEKFTGADFSEAMLLLHPSSDNIQKIFFDFNSIKSFREISSYDYDMVISSSALQWSQDLDMTLKEISQLSNQFYFAIFTSNTFKTLHQIGRLQSPIYSKKSITNSILDYYNASFELINYQLYFDSVYEMLRYIKQSGVSGGKKQLSYKEIKKVIRDYPLDYLEFEVLFIKATKK